MAITATPEKIWEHPDPSTGKVRWTIIVQESNFNDTEIGLTRSTFAFAYNRGPSYITRISASWRAQSSGAGCLCVIDAQCRSSSDKWCPILRILSTAEGITHPNAADIGVEECRVYIPNDQDYPAYPTPQMLRAAFSPIAAGFANDDFTMFIDGETLPLGVAPAVEPVSMPVSLEGYRWPLTRRY